MFDSFFTKGHSHKVCEDYAVHSNVTAVLCDGCSSVEHSDIGARALAHSFLRKVNPVAAYTKAFCSIDTLGLEKLCLCSTIGRISLYPDNLGVELWGDGSCILVDETGKSHLFDVDYDNKPFYLFYDAEGIRDQYIKEFGNKYKLTTVYNKTVVQEYPLPMKFEPALKVTTELEYIKAVFLCSDGIKSSGKDLNELVSDLVDLKSYSGEFLTRRIKKLLATKWKDYIFQDDLGIVGWCNESLCQ